MTAPLAVELPLGLPGISEGTRWRLHARAPGSAYAWLGSADDESLELLTIEAVRLCPDYPVEQVRRALGFLHLPDDEPLWVLALCTVPGSPQAATADLLAPIGVGTRCGRGAQIVLHDARWSTPVPLPP